MILTLKEKEKLYEKANNIYEKIKNIKIRREIHVDVKPNYYDSNSRYASYGFKYYVNGSVSIFANDIKDCLKELKNYIDFKNGVGEKYIDGKSVEYLSTYTINALLDFLYYGYKIIKTIEDANELERKNLNDLLS